MKNILILFIILLGINNINSQDRQPTKDSVKLVCIILNDKTEIVGEIIENNSREITIKAIDGREMIIPQFTVKTIKAIKESSFDAGGHYVGKNNFSTRYFLTTNGLPLEKGENYIQWTLFGPDIQFGVSDKVGVGVMTSWLGVPIIGTVKYSDKINEKTHFAIGTLVGTGSWVAPSVGGVLPFASLTYGTSRLNINFSAGYGAVWADGDRAGRAIFSVAGIAKITKKSSLVFDSFILSGTGDESGFAILLPGIRIHNSEQSAFQFGFAAFSYEGSFAPLPVPMVQWFRTF